MFRDESGSKNFDQGRVKFFVAQVESGGIRHLWFGLGFGKFPPNRANFSIFFLSVN